MLTVEFLCTQLEFCGIQWSANCTISFMYTGACRILWFIASYLFDFTLEVSRFQLYGGGVIHILSVCHKGELVPLLQKYPIKEVNETIIAFRWQIKIRIYSVERFKSFSSGTAKIASSVRALAATHIS